MSPRSTRFTGISGSRTVLSASITWASSAGSPPSGSGRSTSSSIPPESGRKSKKFLSSGCSTTTLLRLHRDACRAVLERRLESMPGERRAFDAGGIGAHAGQRLEPVHILFERRRCRRSVVAGDLGMKALEERIGLGERLAAKDLGHQRSRRRRDGATATLEAHILDPIAIERDIDGHAIAAQRIMPVGEAIGVLRHPEIPGVLTVIENDVLIEIAQIHG